MNETVEDGGGCFVAGSTKEGNSGSVAAPKPDEPQDFYNDKKEHVYTDKEIIGLAEKEIGSLRQQLKDTEDLCNFYKSSSDRLEKVCKSDVEGLQNELRNALENKALKESIKELIEVAGFVGNPNVIEIVSRAKALLDKQ